MLGLRKRARGDRDLGLDEVPRPVPGPEQVLVEVHATGICGTDLHIRDDEFASLPPVVMGHEVTGRVVEAGPGAEAHVGRRVALETYFHTCDQCSYCRAGQRNLCPERRSIGSHVNGGFASHVLVPATNLHDVAPLVSDHAGALYEPLACVAHCLCDPAVASPGDRALVVGPGAMGILAAQVLRAQGAAVTVSGTTRDVARLAVVDTLGLTTVTADSLAAATPGGGFDVVADCSGSPAGIDAGLRATRRGGQYVQIGLAGRPIELDIDLVCLRELTVTSGFASTPRSWQRAEVLVDGGHVRLEPLVSGAFPLARWQDAFERTSRAEGLKLVIDPRLGGGA
ncbi:zinc-binding dehydrogenase [soil metagenome]